MNIAYASKTGHVEKIVNKLGLTDALKIMDGTEKIEAPYVIFTYTTGKGKTPKQVELFLAANPGVAAVVGSGSSSKSHIETFNFAAENISKAYNVPVLAKVDGVGTDEDMAHIKEELEKL
ncbi:MAG: class Ib ribonucleoside-diphosphate reductase assembly flavoprotein NrdI [Clostridia bacterium]|nr:class Ib ribonucleoside-diphosphate reductase assembly flavoprotein NrdI [Clostridia bacterium]MBR0408765.1 class Ib ribonucleoside-diphosphate reductase assembly flavoprotein NrdI [Clostridia bacterium]